MITNKTPKRKKITVWLYEKDYRLVDYLAQKVNISEFAKDVLNQYMNGNLIPREHDDLKRKKLQVDIRFKEVMIKIKEKELLYANTFSKSPTFQAKKAMKIGVENQVDESPSCFDESNHRIMCPECGACFVFAEDQHDIGESKINFLDHYFQKHNKELPKKIQSELE